VLHGLIFEKENMLHALLFMIMRDWRRLV